MRMRPRVGSKIRIKDLQHIYSKWRGREAVVESVRLNSLLWVETSLDGVSLLFKEDEVEVLEEEVL